MSHFLAGAIIGAEDSDFATLGKLFVIAVIIVAPFARKPLKKILASDEQPEAQPEKTDRRDLGVVTAEIDKAKELLSTGEVDHVDIEYPSDPHLDGRPVPDALAKKVIGDFVRGAGLISSFVDGDESAEWREPTAASILRCTLPR